MARRWRSELRRILEQPSQSYVRTQGDDLEVEQTRLHNRERTHQSLGFRRVLPHVACLFGHVRGDVYPPDPAPGTPNGQHLHHAPLSLERGVSKIPAASPSRRLEPYSIWA